MEPHVLTCVPAYGYIFHTLEVYLYPTCTAPSQSGVYLELNQATVMESFCKNNTFHQQTHTHTHARTQTLFWNLLVFWQNMSAKFSLPILSVNLEYFIIRNKIQNSINIQSRRNQTFTVNDGFYRIYTWFVSMIVIIMNI